MLTLDEKLVRNGLFGSTNIKKTKIRSTFTHCDCGKEVWAFICFHKDGKVYWNNKCPDHKLDAKKLSDWPEMPKDELDKYLRSLV
jgi:hypothetical protein